MNVFGQAIQVPFMSKRYAMKRYLVWTDDEIVQNERMFMEESGQEHPMTTTEPGMIDVGVRPSDPGDLAPPTDMDMGDEGGDMMPEPGMESPISGAENAPAGGAPAPLTPV